MSTAQQDRTPLHGLAGERVARLVEYVQQLSLARDVGAVQQVVKHAARTLAQADGATFVLRDEGMCFYADEDAIAPLWKGRRFPLEACISGWAMQHRQAVAISDVYADERIPHDAYRPTFVRSLLMTPIRTVDPLGAIGVYWACEREVTAEETALLQALADSTAVAMQSAQLWQELEARVAARTEELAAEVEERRRAEAQVRELSITDELTGLRNRRGFLHLASQEHGVQPRGGEQGLVVFVDVDGLKAVNDTLGHGAGDELLRAAAQVLLRCFRPLDVVGRVGGDEFAVYVPGTADHAAIITARIAAETERYNASASSSPWLSMSVGVTRAERDASLEELLSRADRAMYQDKMRRRAHALPGVG